MTVGSSYATLKAAIVDQLSARPGLSGVSVSYQAPEQAPDVQGSTGSGESIWLDNAEGEHDNVVICSLPLHLEELYELRVVVQVLRPSSQGTQQRADLRVDELLREVLQELATDPTFGLSGQTPFDYLHVTRAAFRRRTGYLPNGAGHGAACELLLRVECRLSFNG